MQTLALAALGLSGSAYILLGIRAFLRARTLGDQLPMSTQGAASIFDGREFSATTVATTISLATVILAFTELAPFFGPWLLWTAITTAAGLLVMRWASPVIWRALQDFGGQRPTLHGFLGASFNSSVLARTAAFCTALGFLGALAVELTVGSRFLASLVPDVNPTLAVILLAGLGVAYTLMGGFRVVVETDRVQMVAIWIAILALGELVILRLGMLGGVEGAASSVTPGLFDFGWREGLGPFLLGISVINVPTFLADMAMWQRIGATREEKVLKAGLSRSVAGAILSWSSLAILACLVVALEPTTDGNNPLALFLTSVPYSPAAAVGVFIVVVGLYGASLSTASTQLIAASHTLHIDLLRATCDGPELASSVRELRLSRVLILVVGLGSITLVEALRAAGFTIADLVFAIYGAQLGLVPAVLLALFGSKDVNHARGLWVAVAVVLGFIAGWSVAGYGKWIGDGNLVFLAPVASLLASSAFCLASVAFRPPRGG